MNLKTFPRDMEKQIPQKLTGKKIVPLFLGSIFILCFSTQLLQAQNLHWVRQFAKSGPTNYGNWSRSVVVDVNYNVYTVGEFEGTVDFDPGAGVSNLTATTAGGGKDIFVSKIDSSGNFLWAINMGGSGYNEGHDIALDNAGNCYITGMHDDTTDFDPGPGVSNLIGFMDPYVAKYDPNGNLVWVKEFVGPYDDYGFSITVSDSDHVFFTGNFGATMDFDPGPGVANLTSSPNKNTYIVKLTSAGNYVWAKNFYCDLNVIGTSIDTDPTGKVYIGGIFYGTADFDPGAGTNNQTTTGSRFVCKLDNAGSFMWANHVEGDLSNPLQDYPDLSVDNNGNVYSAYQFVATADFDPGPGVANLTSSGSTDAYVLKQDYNGKYKWAARFGRNSADEATGVYSDGAGLVYTSGFMRGTVDFDPGAGIIELTSTNTSAFLSVLDSAGNFYWAANDPGAGTSYAWAVTADALDKIYLTGHFWGTIDFEPDPTTINLTGPGSLGELFVQRLRYLPGLGLEDEQGSIQVNIYPNPVSDMITIDFLDELTGPAEIEIYNELGQLIQKTTTISNDQAVVDFRGFAAGVYMLKVQSGNASKTWKLIKQ